jgi:hypothetical protein
MGFSAPAGLTCAWIHGTASRLIQAADPQGDSRAAAIKELRQAATHHRGKLRADLLSQQAGRFAGLRDGDEIEWHRTQNGWMAALCAEAAGEQLDEGLVAEWTAIGRERASRRR